MKELKISSVIRRKKNKYIKSPTEYMEENILNREFSAATPQHKVLTDVTEFKYGKDKKYICATLDLYDRSILSYSLSEKFDTKLVLEVLQNSFNTNVSHDTILYIDRGSQFTSSECKKH